MKGMILAAGFGTRLKPLTDIIPKALIEYKSKPLIVYQIERLKELGVDEIIVNIHHLPDKINEKIDTFAENFRIKIHSIYEPEILGTGGGILNAGKYLKKSEFSIICNVDVFTDFELNKMIDFHKKQKPLATILVQKRATTRYLRFNEEMKLIGRASCMELNKYNFAFNGIHIISKKFFELNIPVKYYDVIDLYLNLVNNGEVIYGFNAGDSKFKDLGKPENLTE